MSRFHQPELFDASDLMIWRRCQVCRCALSVAFAHLYVVQRQVWIKIGATNNPRRRINELSRPAWKKYILYPRLMDWDAPLYTLAVIDLGPGGGVEEHRVHERFAEHHVIGEWFSDKAEIRQWIQEAA